ncbi:asparagine synthetase domain-containing protein [Achlya hypogyna]|uniref:Asparagine synthetase domain-containing protein n=1 Tax=Achlya hypogyna TaxID=1202772 RepID=A0A1V9YRJ3_ACHHY|nr:asparagine synthetase domain-containing protein [Achlya hypogyna]
MCGIAAVAGPTATAEAPAVRSMREALVAAINRRGPDHCASVRPSCGDTFVELSAAVLHLRGGTMAQQPAMDASGNVLLWNGEVFGGATPPIPLTSSDTSYVANLLYEATLDDTTGLAVVEHAMAALAALQGPFAICWLHAATNTLVFGRDHLGRRSLLLHAPESPDDVLVVASVSHAARAFIELPCTGLFYTSLHALSPQMVPWNLLPVAPKWSPLPLSLEALAFDEDPMVESSSMLSVAKNILRALANAVRVRVESIPIVTTGAPRVAVLFSGGLDSVVLAALAHHYLPPDEPIELFNICFDAHHASPDRKAARASWQELTTLFPTRPYRFVEMNVPYSAVTQAQGNIMALLQPRTTHMDFNIGAAFWFLSRGIGAVASNDVLDSTTSDATSDAVATAVFGAKTSRSQCFAAKCTRQPLRTCPLGTCRTCCSRLHKYCRKIGLNVHPQEAASARAALTAMGVCDVEAALAAATCTGHTLSPAPPTTTADSRPQYHSKVKVLLVGIGADEQLAGYGRHKKAFETGGIDALRAELSMDMARIWERNLGRDDRILSDHGREARFPYLDERVVAYLQAVSLSDVVDFRHPRGVGDKMVLRVVARQLGLRHCTGLPKQAIQFGTRIAKQSDAAVGRRVGGATAFETNE